MLEQKCNILKAYPNTSYDRQRCYIFFKLWGL